MDAVFLAFEANYSGLFNLVVSEKYQKRYFFGFEYLVALEDASLKSDQEIKKDRRNRCSAN